jgi:hypothetical protein
MLLKIEHYPAVRVSLGQLASPITIIMKKTQSNGRLQQEITIPLNVVRLDQI